ncbi:MAG TPA: hypothetical protein VFU10_10225 [Gaiellaceae bacterium]|nr:hypothetical protein [Gaiellaceae bacterium]
MHLTFLTPAGALLALAAILPLGALALNERRAGRARRALGVDAPALRVRAPTALALAAVPVLLGLALAQPVIESRETVHERTDAQVFYVFDTSISMRAASGPEGPTRLARAIHAGLEMRSRLSDMPSGVATMTDRVLPNIFPTGDDEVFSAALADTVGIERPPPKGLDQTATTFAALDTFAGDSFFSPGTKHRVVVLLTDGETAPYFPGDLREALRPTPRVHFVIVRFWHKGERIRYGGAVDRNYRPDVRSEQAVRTLASVVSGKAFDESNLGGAVAAARGYLGKGPVADVGEGLRVTALSRWLVLLTLIPLAFLLWRRNLG